MPSRNKFIIIVVLSTVFGLFSGVVGSLVARVYLLEEAFNVPLLGELSFDEQQNGSSIVIHNAKKVVVEQNVKIDEVARSGKESLLRIYDRIDNDEKQQQQSEKDSRPDYKKGYRIDNYLSQGFILTSDGWMVTEFLPQEIATYLTGVVSTSSKLALKKALESYVIIDKDEKQYDVATVVYDDVSGFTFWKIEATGLPVKKFGQYDEITSGQVVLALNSDGQVLLTSISGIKKDETEVEFSDVFDPELLLNEKINEKFFSSFLFDINGDVVGIIDKTGTVKPISSFISCINCLLLSNEIKRPTFGVYYVDLSKYILNDNSSVEKGALISSNKAGVAVVPLSPADELGLLEGDIILSLNGRELNKDNSLSQIINSLKVGDDVSLEYLREGKIIQAGTALEGR